MVAEILGKYGWRSFVPMASCNEVKVLLVPVFSRKDRSARCTPSASGPARAAVSTSRSEVEVARVWVEEGQLADGYIEEELTL